VIRVTDYIANCIYNQGVSHVFMVTGGGLMFLSDDVALHTKLKAVCTHHEQAAAMAAVSYAKYNENIGACYLTTGCGGTNAITGLLNGWQDSIPCLFISGQSKRKETIRNSGLPLRQFGVQEADIISVVQSLTKYATMVNDPERIAYHLDKAIFLARSGRPGPVWLDIPLDVQGAMINTDSLIRFEAEERISSQQSSIDNADMKEILKMIEDANRPIIVAGQGIRLGKAIREFQETVDRFQIPVVSSSLGIDLLASNDPLFIGRIGNKGDRPGNMAVQNSDLVISIGCRLSVSSTGHEYHNFAREAKIVVIDIDPIEHKKNTVRIDMLIRMDVRSFLQKLNNAKTTVTHKPWIEKCGSWKKKYPVCLPVYKDDSNGINLYYFVDCLSKALKKDSVVISDAGSAFYVTTQAIQLEKGQRLITTGGQAEMGYTLPATIGVCFAKNKGQVIGITGDGSFQTNIQELQTIVHHNLPIKIFVWNNDGYLSIRATQRKFFDSRFIGTDNTSGVSFPNLKKISAAYGIKYLRIDKAKGLTGQIQAILNEPDAAICEVICIRDQLIVPTVSSIRRDDGTMVSKPLEDMYPFLNREEFKEEMIVKPLE